MEKPLGSNSSSTSDTLSIFKHSKTWQRCIKTKPHGEAKPLEDQETQRYLCWQSWMAPSKMVMKMAVFCSWTIGFHGN